jgi:antirestriction protein
MTDCLDLRDLSEEYKGLLEREQGPDNPLDEDEKARLAALSDLEGQLFTGDLAEYAENESTMIPEEDFEDYAQEFAEDVGYMLKQSDNPLFSYIDWTSWAEDMKHDYTEVTFEDRTYLIRVY